MVATTKNKNLSDPKNIEQLESMMLNLPQVDCPVSHFFGPGIYIRQLTMLAGTTAIGHYQKEEHLNVMLKGKVAIIDGDKVKVLTAPQIFVGKPGRKIGHIMEDCVWQNIYATDETDIDKLEEMFLDKSQAWQDNQIKNNNRDEDNKDFLELIKENGFTEELVREQSENEEDQIPMPKEYAQVITVRDSSIEGKGIFANWGLPDEMIVGPARINGMRTPLGRYTNHSKSPNAKFVKVKDDIYLVTTKEIHGCKGGGNGDEITVDYRQALSLSLNQEKGNNLCQQ